MGTPGNAPAYAVTPRHIPGHAWAHAQGRIGICLGIPRHLPKQGGAWLQVEAWQAMREGLLKNASTEPMHQADLLNDVLHLGGSSLCHARSYDALVTMVHRLR